MPTKMKDSKKYTIKEIFISELGYLMVKLYNEEKQVFTTLNLGNWKDNLNFDLYNINLDEVGEK
jgi:hypothetical protein